MRVNSPETAPTDGTRFLGKYYPLTYRNSCTGFTETAHPKWEEIRFIRAAFGSPGHWEPWCGENRITTTEHIDKLEGWLPLPEESG